jgi:hypothetical protein
MADAEAGFPVWGTTEKQVFTTSNVMTINTASKNTQVHQNTDAFLRPAYRKLKGFAFDPSFANTIDKRQSNEVVYKVPWEDIEPGPVGEYIEVIDYDPTKQCFYEAVDLNNQYVLANEGIRLSQGDPRFHQQQVYAVVMNVIHQFEKALGRKINWSRLVEKKGKHGNEYTHEFIARLRIYPHAMRQQNAYFSPDKMALLFGYFQASNQWGGNNIPGATVFTCLSPDIVAHEATHAILHSLHPYLTRDTNPDMLAFHEGFSDIIALLQRFTFRSVVEDQIRNSRGDILSPQNLLGDLAIQFGEAISGNRRALRSYLIEDDGNGNWKLIDPDPSKYYTETEPHSRGGLLVAAVFDAFARLYRYKIADLLRLASNGTGILAQGEIHPDLVKRLSFEACEIAGKLMQVCIRALDYCPPTDLNFGDYLRALITADIEYNYEDEDGLRFALLESFRRWGIIPNDVNTYSVEALTWKSLDVFYEKNPLLAALKKVIKSAFDPDIDFNTEEKSRVNKIIEKILRKDDRQTIFEETGKLAAIVHNIFSWKFDFNTRELERLLGMSFQGITYHVTGMESDKTIVLKAEKRDAFQVYRCRPLIRCSQQTGSSSKLLLITFLQKVYVNLAGSCYEGLAGSDNKYEFRGGATLIIDLATFDIKYAIVKNIASSKRLQKQLQYAAINQSAGITNGLLLQDDEPFAALHLH